MAKFSELSGKRKYACADCNTIMFFHSVEVSRKCKPRCKGCGGTFFEPVSDGAKDMSDNIGAARSVVEKTPPITGKEHHRMQQQ